MLKPNFKIGNGVSDHISEDGSVSSSSGENTEKNIDIDDFSWKSHNILRVHEEVKKKQKFLIIMKSTIEINKVEQLLDSH